MTAPKQAAPPPPIRSPERQRLAEAIAAHADAVARYERVTDARARLDDKYFGELQPKVREAMDQLAAAKLDEPQRFVDTFLGDPQPDGQSVAEAEAALRRAETELERAQKARAMLLEEAGRAEIAVKAAERDLESAVHHVIFTDPRKEQLVAEFERTVRHALRLARAMRTIRVNANGLVSDSSAGLSINVVIGDIGRRDGVGTLYTPDPSWGAAVAALRSDPDAPLPGLPETDPLDASDGTPKAA